MELKFKRSFFGYSPKSVERAINAIHVEFGKQIKDLEEQNSLAEYDIQSLKEEIKKEMDSLADYQASEDKLSKLLLSAHLTSCGKIMEALKLAGQMEERVLHKVLEREKEGAKLKKTMYNISKEIESMTKRYSLALEGSNDE